jgi:micrococcal nuclease
VVDGDTIDVTINGIPATVRYIGIDSPEEKKPNAPIECWAVEAAQANTALVEGQTVRLERDKTNTDIYGRLLRYVWLSDGRFANEALVRAGHAFAKRYKPDTRRAVQLENAMKQAAGAGLWSACTVTNLKTQPISSAGATSPQQPASQQPAATSAGSAGHTFPAVGSDCPPNTPIKGNINSKDEKIYHSPGQ